MTTTAYLILAGIGGYAALIIGILLVFRGSQCWDDDDLRQESMASRWPRRDWLPGEWRE